MFSKKGGRRMGKEKTDDETTQELHLHNRLNPLLISGQPGIADTKTSITNLGDRTQAMPSQPSSNPAQSQVSAEQEIKFFHEIIFELTKENQEMRNLVTVIGVIVRSLANLMTLTQGNISIAILEENIYKLKATLKDASIAAEASAELFSKLTFLAMAQKVIKEPTDLSLVLNEVVHICRILFRNVGISLEAPKELPKIPLNSVQFLHIFMNFIFNSVDALTSINDRPPRIWIKAETAELKPTKFILISFTDNGKGMDSETQKRVFDENFSTKKDEQSKGQGLKVAKTIIENHGGTIDFESKPDVGATFRIFLPVE